MDHIFLFKNQEGLLAYVVYLFLDDNPDVVIALKKCYLAQDKSVISEEIVLISSHILSKVVIRTILSKLLAATPDLTYLVVVNSMMMDASSEKVPKETIYHALILESRST